MNKIFTCLAVSFFSALLSAQTVIPNYESARDDWFWAKLYNFGGESLYCQIEFDHDGRFVEENRSKKMTIEHVYAADWIAEHFGCDNRHSCRSEKYHFAAADLHNLWPAHGSVNSSRSDHLFSEIPDWESENRYVSKGCMDFERIYGVNDSEVRVEPRDLVKGAIARSLLYMADTYGVPLYGMEKMLLHWHQHYPPSFEELWRNKQIFLLQGTSNNWISP